MSTKQDHKKWRKQFNEDCLTRDNHKCVFCDNTENLDVHHITDRKEMPNGGYVMSNGIALCPEHHLKCEAFHMIGSCENDMYLPENLYKKINSSYDTAYSDSLNNLI
jgi:hypothetical protein